MGKALSATIVHIGSANILGVWDHILPFINKALEYNDGELNSSDVLHMLVNNKFQCLVVIDNNEIIAASVFEICNYPQKKVCNVVLIAGDDVSEYKELFLNSLYDIAKSIGAVSIYLHGRKGWKRFLQDDNFKEIYTVLERKL